MTDLTPITQLNKNNPSLSPASSGWGTVYQNYISANLSSEQLLQGAYDAYNLLSARRLSDFQDKAITAINDLISNQESLAEDLQTIETDLTTTNSDLTTTKSSLSKIANNLNSLFSSYDENDQLVSILEGTIRCSKFSLSFPSNDSGTIKTYYDLSGNVTIPFVTDKKPGLLKSADYNKFSKVTSLFNTESTSAFSNCKLSFPSNDNHTAYTSYDLSSNVSIPLVSLSEPGLLRSSDYNKFIAVSTQFTPTITSWSAKSYSDLASTFSPMEVLVFKINRLQSQVNELLSVINGLFSGNSSYVVGKLNVKSINFTSDNVSNISLDNFGNRDYINPDIVKLTN